MTANTAPTRRQRLVSVLLSTGLLAAVPAWPQQGYDIVLRVNERIATSFDYGLRRAEKIGAIRAAESLSAEQQQRMLAEVGVSTMNDIFEELLMLSRADQVGISVSPAEIDRTVAATWANYGIEDEEQFEQALRSSNLTLEGFRSNMNKTLLVQKLIQQEVHPRINLDEEDLRRYYQNHAEDFQEPERVHLEEVVILAASGLGQDDLALTAEAIRRQVQEGVDLGQVVEPYAAEGVTSNAVDLGWVELGDLDPELERAVWSLAAGGVSEPVPGRGGLHVLVVVDRQEARLKTFAEVEQEIRATEGERLLSNEMQSYLEELEARAYIVAKPPPDAAGFRASLQSTSDTDELAEALTAPLITDPALAVAEEAAAEAVDEKGETAAGVEPEKPPSN